MTQAEPPETIPVQSRPLTLQQRRTIQEIWRKVNGIQVQIVRLMAELDIRVQ